MNVLRKCFVATLCIFVLSFAAALAASAQKPAPSKPLDLNTATIEQLEQLPGVGPSTAKAIIQFREKGGPFKRVEDLLAIHGISHAKLEKLRPFVFVTPPHTKPQ